MYEDFFDKEFSYSLRNNSGYLMFFHECKRCFAPINHVYLELHARWHIRNPEITYKMIEAIYDLSD